ncbi:eukaryotic translation initiation factor 5B isoform X3 [Capsella rubella]|uniref:eukaryotic translation initiation factor 5B isoform X3 n=1 Tax=Capsella rubella TaxID=81985 RepID=UPI000CD5B929|nr:eukaryotic translation initiation factor 5B isoform X3 [Capsella rubella]
MSGNSAAMETAEVNLNSGNSNSNDGDATTAIEYRILKAIRSRVAYLRDTADSFTFVSIRRMLEETMGLKKHSLEDHRTFVKMNLVQCLEDADNDEALENPQEPERSRTEEQGERNDVRDDTGCYEEDMECAGEMALGTEEKRSEKVAAKDMTVKGSKDLMHSEIRRALRERSSYIKDNAETTTMGSLRRLLEEDLQLEKLTLDPFKNFINKLLDEVLEIADVTKSQTESAGKELQKYVESIQSKEEVAVKKTRGRKRKMIVNDSDAGDSEIPFKHTKETATTVYGTRVMHLKSVFKSCRMRVPPYIYRIVNKAPEEKREAILIEELEQLLAKEGLSSDPLNNGKHVARTKRAKHQETDSETDSDTGDSENENPSKQTKETAITVYGTRVMHLKSVFKSCRMRVPPYIYRKVNKAPEEKREAILIEELEQLLAKEGLSSDPLNNGQHVSRTKREKPTDTDSETDRETGDSENENPFKTKETAITVYGTRVMHLKSVFKSCRMRVPPYIYRKVNKAPEEKREAILIEELEQLLAKEGLSSDPLNNGQHVSRAKREKPTDTDSETDRDTGDSENENPFKQTKETAITVYGERAEHLKSVFKSCRMRVPPYIYRKANKAAEEKREAILIEELEQILAKEGLSSNPSNKEIKEVNNRRDISEELEGIDASNIVSSSRRRSITSFAPPPKPRITAESESESESDEPEYSENEVYSEEEEEEYNEEAEGSPIEEEAEESPTEEEEESSNGDDDGEESN